MVKVFIGILCALLISLSSSANPINPEEHTIYGKWKTGCYFDYTDIEDDPGHWQMSYYTIDKSGFITFSAYWFSDKNCTQPLKKWSSESKNYQFGYGSLRKVENFYLISVDVKATNYDGHGLKEKTVYFYLLDNVLLCTSANDHVSFGTFGMNIGKGLVAADGDRRRETCLSRATSSGQTMCEGDGCGPWYQSQPYEPQP